MCTEIFNYTKTLHKRKVNLPVNNWNTLIIDFLIYIVKSAIYLLAIKKAIEL